MESMPEPEMEPEYVVDPDGWPLCTYCEPLYDPANFTYCSNLTYDLC